MKGNLSPSKTIVNFVTNHIVIYKLKAKSIYVNLVKIDKTHNVLNLTLLMPKIKLVTNN